MHGFIRIFPACLRLVTLPFKMSGVWTNKCIDSYIFIYTLIHTHMTFFDLYFDFGIYSYTNTTVTSNQ